MRKAMVEKDHLQLSVRVQCELLGVNRNRLEVKLKVVWKPKAEDGEKLELIKLAHAKDPTMGTRQLGAHFEAQWVSDRTMDGGQDDAISWTPSHLQQAAHHGARAAERKVSLPSP
ncbi:MAG: hypothetical protein R3F19_16165 [Verrucomicrobiales bacterium]